MPPFGTSPAELIARCTSGDDGALAQFYGEYAETVRRATVRTLRQYGATGSVASETEDLTNEVFAKLLANDCALLDRVRNGRSIQAWLVAITRNHVVDHLRRASARERATTALVREEHSEYMPTHRTPAVSSEHIALVRAAVAALEPGDRLALELYFLQGLTYAQMAEMLHANVNTMSARVRRAKGKLRQILERQGIREP